MTTLKITDRDPGSVQADVLVVAVTDEDGLRVLGETLPEPARTAIAESLDSVGCDGAVGSQWRVPAPQGLSARSVVAVGVPPAPEPAVLREAAGTGVRASRGARSVVVALPDPDGKALSAIAEGTVSADVEAALENIKQAIIAGELSTGWGEYLASLSE